MLLSLKKTATLGGRAGAEQGRRLAGAGGFEKSQSGSRGRQGLASSLKLGPSEDSILARLSPRAVSSAKDKMELFTESLSGDIVTG